MKGLFFVMVLVSVTTLRAQDADSTAGVGLVSTSLDTTEVKHEQVGPDSLETTHAYQSQKLILRNFDSVQWKKVVGGENFEEEARVRKSRVQPLAVPPWAGQAFRLISYLIIFGGILFLLYKVTRNMMDSPAIEKKTVPTEDYHTAVESLDDLDVDALLLRAREAGNHHLAVRLYYLRLLKRLNELGLISWKKDKTNREYLGELVAGGSYSTEVQRLTLAYEQVWYGEHPLSAETFRRIASDFEDVQQHLNPVNR